MMVIVKIILTIMVLVIGNETIIITIDIIFIIILSQFFIQSNLRLVLLHPQIYN